MNQKSIKIAKNTNSKKLGRTVSRGFNIPNDKKNI